jgi:hypothetical protein
MGYAGVDRFNRRERKILAKARERLRECVVRVVRVP